MKQLKSFMLLAVLLLTALPLAAEPVDAVRALDAARAFFQHDRNFSRRMAPVTQVSLSSAPLTKAGEAEPAYRIFNRAGGGFVIIAGDDACSPVLAYSFTNQFGAGEDMPEGLRALLTQYEEMVFQARSRKQPAGGRRASAWESLSVLTKAGEDEFQPEVKLVTPVWGQGAPFNRLAPSVEGEPAVAGCVPLAMAMIMRFHTWPLHGEGTLPSYGYSIKAGTSMTIPAVELGYPYEWDKIRYEYTYDDNNTLSGPHFTEEEADAVARLVYDCGVAVRASFDNSTSAYTRSMVVSAIDHFGFDPHATTYEREFYTDDEWIAILKRELQERPVLYAAHREGPNGSRPGHAFVLDGYDAGNRFSINWGWNGSSNGYFELSDFSPNGSQRYLLDHSAVLGLKPSEGGEEVTYLYLSGGTSSSGAHYQGLSCSETIQAGKTFNVTAGFFYNGGNRLFKGRFAVALLDADEQVKEIVSSERELELEPDGGGIGWSSTACKMTRYPLAGDHLSLVFRSDDWPENQWQLPICSREGGVSNRIDVKDTQTLAEATGVNFSKITGELTIRTKDDVTWQLLSPSGEPLTEGIVQEGNQLVCKMTDRAKGNYTLTLKRGEDSVTLTIKMGEVK